MILSLIVLFIVAFASTMLIVPANIRFSLKNKIVDAPHKRGIHTTTIPLAGGISFGVVSVILQIIVFSLVKLAVGLSAFVASDVGMKLLYLAIAGILILLLGFFDDKRKFTAKYKLYFQIIIVCFLYLVGFRMSNLTNPFGEEILLGILSFPMTIIWFLLVINAINLIDGLDGLATGIGIIVNIVIGIVGIINGNIFIMVNSVILIGSLLAFLRYNFYPAKIFMGDTGSMFIGVNIAALAVTGTQQFKGIAAITLLIPIIVLIIPLTDTFLAIFRRVKQNINIFEADKKHIHHRLLNLGFNQSTIALICYFITFLFGLIAISFSIISKRIVLSVLLIIAILLILLMFLLIKKLERK